MKLVLAPLLLGGALAADGDLRADSRVGRRLLQRARRLDGGNDDMSWAAGYSLRFEKCATSTDYYGGYFGGNQDGGENQGYNGIYEQRLVHFKLCPTDSCGKGCTGGDYVLDLNEFAQAYMEYRAEAQEQECERVANNCYCENANDDEACEANCYIIAGIYEQCADNQNNNGQEEEFEVEEALECARLDVDQEAAQYYNYGNQDGNNYYNGNQNGQEQEMEFYVGPYCSANGKAVLLGVFMDEVCSYAAPDGTYEKFHYGNPLPYSSESLVGSECISCLQPREEEGNNQNQNYNYWNGNDDRYNYNQNQNQNQEDAEILEMCERVYEDAGKCESNLNVYGLYANTLACDFIQGLGRTSIFSAVGDAASSATPTVLAVVFAATTLLFGGVGYFLHKRLQRQSVGLVHSGGHLG